MVDHEAHGNAFGVDRHLRRVSQHQTQARAAHVIRVHSMPRRLKGPVEVAETGVGEPMKREEE